MPDVAAAVDFCVKEPGIDDAYEKLLSEYVRVEEAAIAAGRTTAGEAGAATWEGRQLEEFIAELDGRFDVRATARHVYGEFKERVRAEAEKLKERMAERLEEAINEADADDAPGSSPDRSATGECAASQADDGTAMVDLETGAERGEAGGERTEP